MRKHCVRIGKLPPPLFAFFIWDGNEVALIQHVDQRPAGDRQINLVLFATVKCKDHTILPVGVKQEAFHNKDMSFLFILMVRLWYDLQGVINAVRLLKLHWVLQPCVDRTHHGVHVQSSDD